MIDTHRRPLSLAATIEFLTLTLAVVLLLCDAHVTFIEHVVIDYKPLDWDIRLTVVRNLSMCYAGLLTALSVCSLTLSVKQSSLTIYGLRAVCTLTQRLKSDLTTCIAHQRITTIHCLLAAVILLGSLTRCSRLDDPMTYDEAFTYLFYVKGRLASAFNYTFPNNHILHTLLVRCSTSLFGTNPAAIRLPACCAGIVTILLVFLLARRLLDCIAGLIASGIVAFAPSLIIYDTMARGYSLVNALSIGMAYIGVDYAPAGSATKRNAMAAITSLGMLAMPSFLFPAVGIYAWIVISMLISRRSWREIFCQFILPSLATIALLTFIFYTPVILVTNGLEPITANRFVVGLQWQDFIHRLPEHILYAAAFVAAGIPNTILSVYILLFAIGGVYLFSTRNYLGLSMLPALLGGAFTVLVLKHAIPFLRTWLFVIPFISIAIAAGARSLFSLRQHMLSLWRDSACSLIVLGVVFMSLPSGNDRSNMIRSEFEYFQEAESVARFLEKESLSAPVAIECAVPMDAPLIFYLNQLGVSVVDKQSVHDNAPVVFAVTSSRWPTDTTYPESAMCYTIRSVRVYRIKGANH